MVESLVTSNETLKRDNGEMQRLLSESREDSRALQEELEEVRASGDHKHSSHRFTNSLTSSIRSAPLSPNLSPSFAFNHFGKRAVSAERGLRRSFVSILPFLQGTALHFCSGATHAGDNPQSSVADGYYSLETLNTI
jgi:hypothetical protein